MTTAQEAFRQPKRWGVLLAYALVVAVNQMMFVGFAPLLSQIQRRYGVSELAASLLLLVFPLLFIVFSVPAGILTDKRGYRFAVGLGALGMVVFSCVRVFDSSFWMLLIGQIGIAVTQPYVVNGISKLVADWFSEEQGAMATGLGTMGMFLGMAVGMAATPALVDAVGFQATMIVFVVAAAVVAVIFALVVHSNPKAKSDTTQSTAAGGFGPLLRNRQLLLLFAISFLGQGMLNGLVTWLEQILSPRGISAEQAGLIGGTLIIGGLIGAVVIPVLSDITKRRKPFLLVSAAVAFATIYPLGTSGDYTLLLTLGAIHGFFLLASLPLLLEMCAQIAGAQAAGAAASVVMLAGNAGSVLVILAVPVIKGDGNDFHGGVVFLTTLVGILMLLGFFAPETFVQRAENQLAGTER